MDYERNIILFFFFHIIRSGYSTRIIFDGISTRTTCCRLFSIVYGNCTFSGITIVNNNNPPKYCKYFDRNRPITEIEIYLKTITNTPGPLSVNIFLSFYRGAPVTTVVKKKQKNPFLCGFFFFSRRGLIVIIIFLFSSL